MLKSQLMFQVADIIQIQPQEQLVVECFQPLDWAIAPKWSLTLTILMEFNADKIWKQIVVPPKDLSPPWQIANKRLLLADVAVAPG